MKDTNHFSHMLMTTCNVTAIMPTYKRPDKLLLSLEKIAACNPLPGETIVHIDNGDLETEEVLKKEGHRFSNLIILKSSNHLGPGASRNRLLARAGSPIVASFDDDSYPIDSDYFERIRFLFEQFPQAAMLEAEIYYPDHEVKEDEFTARWVADFTGCGCAYRLDVFKQTSGYIQRVVGYGAEEKDLALRLHAMGYGILKSPWLRVLHNTRLEHHNSPRITAGVVENHALVPFLRYPLVYWWIGAGQFLRQILWLFRNGRTRGIASGIICTPKLLWQHRKQREVVSAKSVMSYLRLRHHPIDVEFTPRIHSS